MEGEYQTHVPLAEVSTWTRLGIAYMGLLARCARAPHLLVDMQNVTDAFK